MKLAVTGATGFLGRYLLANAVENGHTLRCWFRPRNHPNDTLADSVRRWFALGGSRVGFEEFESSIDWRPGTLGDPAACRDLVEGCDAVVHAALHHPGGGFRGGEGDPVEFVTKNVVGTIELIEAARAAGVPRFIFVSTCAVHERILADRPLDETHPLWPRSHYGAHKAAIEKFVHSYGLGHGYTICSLRPTGIYGLASPPEDSRWFKLVQSVARGERVACDGGGKEVHAADVARAVQVLLTAPAERIVGEAFNCYDRYISQHEVATLARQMCGSRAEIVGEPTRPKNQILVQKLRSLGMEFGGKPLLEQTIREMLERC